MATCEFWSFRGGLLVQSSPHTHCHLSIGTYTSRTTSIRPIETNGAGGFFHAVEDLLKEAWSSGEIPLYLL